MALIIFVNVCFLVILYTTFHAFLPSVARYWSHYAWCAWSSWWGWLCYKRKLVDRNLAIATHAKKMRKQIIFVVNQRFSGIHFGQWVIKTLRLTIKMIYLCIFMLQVATDGCNGQVLSIMGSWQCCFEWGIWVSKLLVWWSWMFSHVEWYISRCLPKFLRKRVEILHVVVILLFGIGGAMCTFHYKKIVYELTETCPNHDVLIDGFLSLWTHFYQFGHFLSTIRQLGRRDSDMFLSIRTMFSCSVTSSP